MRRVGGFAVDFLGCGCEYYVGGERGKGLWEAGGGSGDGEVVGQYVRG